jgi:hypothetical protein
MSPWTHLPPQDLSNSPWTRLALFAETLLLVSTMVFELARDAKAFSSGLFSVELSMFAWLTVVAQLTKGGGIDASSVGSKSVSPLEW